MSKKNLNSLAFLLVSALLAGRFAHNLKQRAARAFPDKFDGATFSEHLALIWEVLRWNGPHLAPDGVYYLVGYVSVPTPTGPIGLLPGQELRAVRETGSRLTATAPAVAGTRELEVPRSAVTDDLDLARNLAIRDWTAHREFRDQVEAEAAERERVRLGLYKEAAADLALAERNRMNASDAGIGSRPTVLHQNAVVHRSYSYPVAVPVYVPVGSSGGNRSIAGSVSTSSAGTTSGGITLGGSTAARAAASTNPTHTTWHPGTPPPEARAAGLPNPRPTPALTSGGLSR